MKLPTTLRYTICLFGFEIFLGAFRFLDWNQGLARAALLGLVMLLLLTLRFWPDWLVGEVSDGRYWTRAVLCLVAVAAAWNISMMTLAIAHTVKTGKIRLDQGQDTYRAALELRKGRNPYAEGALLDIDLYGIRMPKRIAAGVGPTIPAPTVEAELARYWDTLNPAIREKLLPVVPPNGSASARQEASILGYKYGPVLVVLTAALAPILGPAAVPVTNGAACLALFVVIALILEGAGAGVIGGGLALCAVMIDPWITYSYILSSATDVWPLLFGFAAVLCALRRWHTGLGISLALALGSKMFPAALFLPLLITVRSVRAIFAFGVAMTVLFLPWMAWDAHGLLYNSFFWLLRDRDSTSWVYYTATDIAIPIRVILGGFIALLLYMLISSRERQCAWVFAALNLSVVAGASTFHNNYVPWFSIWVVLAIAGAFCVRMQHRGLQKGMGERSLTIQAT